jgi:hypothetical protein
MVPADARNPIHRGDSVTDTEQPSAEDVAKAGEVSAAAAGAVGDASSEAEARERGRAAIRQKAREVDLKLSDEDCNKIVDMFVDRLNALGAFDQPAPAPAAQEAPAPEVAAEAAAEVSKVEAPPRKLTWAEKHFGNA